MTPKEKKKKKPELLLLKGESKWLRSDSFVRTESGKEQRKNYFNYKDNPYSKQLMAEVVDTNIVL